MATPNIQETLRQGVEAARAGEKLAARRLLQQVLMVDRRNEVALMWMASVSDTLEDRRAYLKRALQVNPDNERARQALERLGDVPDLPGGGERRQRAVSEDSGANPNLFIVLLALLALVVVVIVVLFATTPQPAPAQTPALVVLPSDTAVQPTRQMQNITPTATKFTGVIVTLDPNTRPTLPPTFTQTVPPTPTSTATPTPPPPGPESVRVMRSDTPRGEEQTSLFLSNGAGGDAISLSGGGFGDIAISTDGRLLAFVRRAGDAGLPQVFAARLNDDYSLGEVRQLTFTAATTIAGLTISADSAWIAFASNEDGDLDIYRVPVAGGGISRITNNNAIDTQPAYSPVTPGQLVYVSDVNSPGFTDLYTTDPERPEQFSRLYDDPGNAYWPAWSADGQRIAYISTSNPDPDVFVVSAAGVNRQQITIDDGAAEDSRPAWSADGRFIAFASNREDAGFRWYLAEVSSLRVTRINPDDSEAGRLVFLPGR